MKRMISIIILVCMLLTLSGCSDTENPVVTDGGDVVYEAANVLTLTDTTVITKIKKVSSGYMLSTINMKNAQETLSYVDSNFVVIREVLGDTAELLPDRYRKSAFEVDDDALYFVYMDEGNTLSGRRLMKYDMEGNYISETMLDAPEEVWDGRVIDDVYLTDTNIVLVSSVGVQICDRSGKTVKELCRSDKSAYYINSSAMDADGTLYIGCTEQAIPYLLIIDSSTGDIIKTYPFTFGNIIRNIAVDGKKVYIQNDYALQLVNASDGSVQNLCDIRDYNAINDPAADMTFYYQIVSLLSFDGKIYYVYTNNTTESDIVYLRQLEGEEKAAVIKKKAEADASKSVIRLFLPYKDNILTDILYRYETEKNAKIEVESYSDSFLNFNISDYLQVVSTRILSGDCGWDIMSTEVIPYIQYSQKGYFADLYTLDQGATLRDDKIYYTNILKACSNRDSLYYFPMSIKFFGLSGISTESVSDLHGLYNLISDKHCSVSFNRDFNFSYLFEQSFNNFCHMDYDKTSFERDNYISTLKELKRFYDADFYSQSAIASVIITREDELSGLKNVNNYSPFSILPVNDYTNPFELMIGYAVMEDSTVKDDSLDLLTKISENYIYRYGINRENVNGILSDLSESYHSGGMFNKDPAKSQEFISALLKIYDSFDTAIYYDINIFSLAYNQAESYCKGEIDENTAADKVEQAFKIFKNEN